MSSNNLWFGRYCIESVLSRHGRHRVYQAFDIVGQNQVAIKVTRVSSKTLREADVLKNCGGSSYLPRFYRSVVENGWSYLVMELVTGWNLLEVGKALEPGGRVQFAVMALLSVIQGLEYLHSTGTIHLDIAPQNIMVVKTDPRRLKIVDFCAARKQIAPGMWLVGRREGTVGFRSPEQERAPGIVDQRADLYAAARLGYWLATGTLLMRKKVEIDAKLCAILKKGMAQDRNDRFRTASEFYSAVRDWRVKQS